MNQIPNIEENKLAGKVVICDGLYTGKVGTILGIGSSQYSIKLLVDGLERYEPDYALLHVTEDNEQAIKLFLAHHQQLQKAREEERKLCVSEIAKARGQENIEEEDIRSENWEKVSEDNSHQYWRCNRYGELAINSKLLNFILHQQLQKALAEGYEQGYTQGKFNEKMDAEYKHPEELQKARQDGYNAGLADGTDKPLLAIEQRVQKAREDERDRIKALFPKLNPNSDSWGTTEMERILKAIDQSELDQDNK